MRPLWSRRCIASCLSSAGPVLLRRPAPKRTTLGARTIRRRVLSSLRQFTRALAYVRDSLPGTRSHRPAPRRLAPTASLAIASRTSPARSASACSRVAMASSSALVLKRQLQGACSRRSSGHRSPRARRRCADAFRTAQGECSGCLRLAAVRASVGRRLAVGRPQAHARPAPGRWLLRRPCGR